MTVLDDVRRFIGRLVPDAVCDDCIADRFELSVRQHANHKTRELAGAGGFERRDEALKGSKATRGAATTGFALAGD